MKVTGNHLLLITIYLTQDNEFVYFHTFHYFFPVLKLSLCASKTVIYIISVWHFV